jgi:hypothetical protein
MRGDYIGVHELQQTKEFKVNILMNYFNGDKSKALCFCQNVLIDLTKNNIDTTYLLEIIKQLNER